ncbi:MAG: hypothetical protein ABR511_00040 [Acidimicrobiales bacterium]
MFARGVERRRRPAHGLVSAVFGCSACGRALELERVVSADVERDDTGVTGWVVFRHHCPCSPATAVVTRAWATHPAFVALFGSQPWLPYRAPFTWGAVADDEPVLARWRWELGQVADAREFLLFLDANPQGHPRADAA